MNDSYEDIINLPHHVSKKYPQMPVSDRAAQFIPFMALTGYEDAVEETARLTDRKIDFAALEGHAAAVSSTAQRVRLQVEEREKQQAGWDF